MGVTFGDLLTEGTASSEAFMAEVFKVKVNSKGERTKRRRTRKGEKLVDGKKVRMGASERRNRSRAAKKAAKKRRLKRSSINRKTAKAMAKRKEKGL